MHNYYDKLADFLKPIIDHVNSDQFIHIRTLYGSWKTLQNFHKHYFNKGEKMPMDAVYDISKWIVKENKKKILKMWKDL